MTVVTHWTVTPWFSPATPPHRVGWYEYRADGLLPGIQLVYWNGEEWGYWALGVWWNFPAESTDWWRGLGHAPRVSPPDDLILAA